MEKKKSILIVDDNPILREGMRSLLSSQPGLDVVGEAGDGLEAIDAVDKFLPDLVLMDLSMPRMDGMEATREIKKKRPETKVLAFTVHKTEEYIVAALAAGANGYLLKDTSYIEMIQSIEDTLEGKKVLGPDISAKVSNG